MSTEMRQGVLLARRPGLALGLPTAIAAVVVSTLAIYPLKEIADVRTLGVVYLVGVVFVASVWGLGLGLLTALVSAITFNFVHFPPVFEFFLDDAEDVVSICVFMLAAVATSALADRVRTQAAVADARREEADLGLELSRLLLGGNGLDASVAAASRRLAEMIAVPESTIELAEVESDERRLALPLRDDGRRVGTLLLPQDTPPATKGRIEQRVVPTVAALLDAAVERDQLVGEVVETRAQARVAQQAGAQHDAARALAEANTLEEAAPRLVQSIGEALGWDLGVLWIVDESAQALRSRGYWTRSEELAAAHPQETVDGVRLVPGEAVAGAVWRSRTPVWVSDLAQDSRFDLPSSGA